MALQKETVKIEGFEDVLKALRESKKVTRERLSIKVQDAERELVQKVKQAAPVETGALREAIEAHPGKGLVGYVGIKSGEVRGRRPDVYYRFPEFGTQTFAQRPYIRPTTNSFAERFLNLLRSAGEEIERDLTGGGGLL